MIANPDSNLTPEQRLDIVFSGPPGPYGCEFVEVERNGESISFGEWVSLEDRLWALRILDPEALLKRLDAAEARVKGLEAVLTRLRDCDWIITLPDRMDAVRAIARSALNNHPVQVKQQEEQ